jgi:hypothetical protein
MTFSRPRAIDRAVRALSVELRALDKPGATQTRPGAQEEREMIEAAIALARALAGPPPARRAA